MAALVPLGTAPARAESPPDPVIFVHGRNAGPGVWDAMRADFATAGYPQERLYAWSYDTSRSSNETLAGEFAAYVDGILTRTGAEQADVVTHSLGGLPTRWYLAFGGGTRKVAHWVSLGGPNHGTGLAYLCALWDQGCKDMTPGSYVLSHLNTGDETPGPTRYATWWSSCDEQITPVSSTALDGAENHRAAGCLKHNDLLTDDAVARQVRAFLRASVR
ncbi:triacylglycerol lipase [Streptomyces sp. VNUA116]|uniref:esterase/lipase family protein n=1 Tax=Streptomyces sp. VNUA116 TaxID=3062449 RepID=UPI00267597D0|nr:triacylglycerol lipase [Streptomyces sp. VNUA116]WKU43857.1 triacylglycerol lipase [Streptomyces sp. VNUA116]